MAVSRRHVLRMVVPPLLALGLVGVLTDPMDAASMPTVGDLAATQAPAGATPSSASGGVIVSIPPVSFAREVRSIAGRVHTPVLLADPVVTGSAYVMPGTRCPVALTQGVISWLTCDSPTGSVVRVMLSDGRVFQTVVR